MAVQSEAISKFENFLKLSSIKANTNPSNLFNNYRENPDIVFALSPKAQELLTKLPTSGNAKVDPNIIVDINKHFSAMEARGLTRESPAYKGEATSMYHLAHATISTLEAQVKSIRELKQPNPVMVEQYQDRIDFYKNLRGNLVANCDLKPSDVLMSVIALGEKHAPDAPAPSLAALQRPNARQTPEQFFESITHPSSGSSGLSRLEQTVYYIATGATDKLNGILGKTDIEAHFAKGEAQQSFKKSNNAAYADTFTGLVASLYTHVRTNQEGPVKLEGAWQKLRDSDVLTPAIMKEIVSKVRDPDLRAGLKSEFMESMQSRGIDLTTQAAKNSLNQNVNDKVVRNLPDRNASNQERAVAPPENKMARSSGNEQGLPANQAQNERSPRFAGGREMT